MERVNHPEHAHVPHYVSLQHRALTAPAPPLRLLARSLVRPLPLFVLVVILHGIRCVFLLRPRSREWDDVAAIFHAADPPFFRSMICPLGARGNGVRA